MTSPDFRPSSWHERLLVLTLGIVLVTTLTFPLIPRFGNAGLIDTAEGRLGIWHATWVAHALATTPRHLLDANMFFPNAGTLAYSDMSVTPGLLGAAVMGGTSNPLATVNAAIALSLLITFLAMWALVRRLTASTGAGVVAAVAYAFSPFVTGASTDVPFLMIFGFPLLCLALHRAMERTGALSAAAVGGALILTALSCGAYGVAAIMLLIVFAAVSMTRDARRLITCAAGVALVLVIAAPIVTNVAHIRAAAAVVPSPNVAHVLSVWATMRAYLASNTIAHRWWLPALRMTSRDRWFPGLVLIVLAAVGVAADRRDSSHRHRQVVIAYGALAGMAFLCSLIAAMMLGSGASSVTPFASLSRLPPAFAALVSFALAVIAGVGARAIGQKHGLWLVGLLALTIADVFVPWPVTTVPTMPAAYRLLATLPRGPVIELPVDATAARPSDESAVLWRSTFNWQPLVNGAGDARPVAYAEQMQTLGAFPDAASFNVLHQLGVRYVIFRMRDYKGDALPALFQRLPSYERYLRRVTAADDVWLYEVVGWPDVSARTDR